MTQETWSAVDRYIQDALLPADAALQAALDASREAGLPPIQVSATQGKLLMLLAQLRGARRILEIGTLGGYSTIWLARALPADGKLVTLEYAPEHARVARANIAAAGLADRVEIHVGPALGALARFARDDVAPFDFTFIDADKPNNPGYVRWALELSRPGSVIVVDNVIRDGAVIDAASTDVRVEGTRRMFEMIASEGRIRATAIQTVGDKGYDGFLVGIVQEKG